MATDYLALALGLAVQQKNSRYGETQTRINEMLGNPQVSEQTCFCNEGGFDSCNCEPEEDDCA